MDRNPLIDNPYRGMWEHTTLKGTATLAERAWIDGVREGVRVAQAYAEVAVDCGDAEPFDYYIYWSEVLGQLEKL